MLANFSPSSKTKLVIPDGGDLNKIEIDYLDTGIIKVVNGDQFTKIDGKKVLKPNVEYATIEGHTYTTDDKGRIVSVDAKLELGNGERNPYAQRTVGGEDRLPTDNGGHLIANIFKGSGEIDNLVPMDATLNKSEYKSLEYLEESFRRR
jgi:predicted ribonuclease toxin of YeeF-YezG toxin-antitoxin module